MRINLPPAVAVALEKLNTAGYEAYVVGGCVRDSLMGKTPSDCDITTSATPSEMQTVFASFRTVETGIQHGTLTVIIDDIPLEITTFRVEGIYSDGRHPDSISFSRHLTEDLQRRDFTINAMAYHPQCGLVDLYGGQNDLSNGIIRCVGIPTQRFSEDALRIIRALRFSAVLHFTIDADTCSALRHLSSSLAKVSVERIATEMSKLLCGKAASRILTEYSDVFRCIIPELPDNGDYHLLSIVASTPIARFAALLWANDVSAECAEHILRRLRLDNHTIRSVARLIRCKNMPYHNQTEILWLLNHLDTALIMCFLSLNEAASEVYNLVNQLLNDGHCYKLSMLAVNGLDLKAIGICDGPAIGDTLHTLLEAVINGDCPNNKRDLLEHVKTNRKPVQ